MQFALLIYQGTPPLPNTDAWSSLSATEQKAIYADYGALNKTPGLIPGPPLGLPHDAKTVRVENGRTITSDGPYIDTNGAVGGYMGFETDNRDAAVAPAATSPPPRPGRAPPP